MAGSNKPTRSRKLGVFNAAGRKISSWIGLGQHQLSEQLDLAQHLMPPEQSCHDQGINHHHLYSKQVSSTPSSPTHQNAEKFQFTKVFKKKSVWMPPGLSSIKASLGIFMWSHRVMHDINRCFIKAPKNIYLFMTFIVRPCACHHFVCIVGRPGWPKKPQLISIVKNKE